MKITKHVPFNRGEIKRVIGTITNSKAVASNDRNIMNKYHHVFHHYDADGYGSAAIYKSWLFDNGVSTGNMEFYSCKHGFAMDFSNVKNPKEDAIVILDYSFSMQEDQENICRLIDEGYDVFWIDHHITSKNIIEDNPQIKKLINEGKAIVDWESNKSATLITYENLYADEEIPKWIKLVDDHDLYKKQEPDSDAFSSYVYDKCRTFFLDSQDGLWAYVGINASIEKGIVDNAISKGKVIMENDTKKNLMALMSGGFASMVEFVDSRGKKNMYRCLCVNARGNSSVFGNYYETTKELYDAYIIFNIESNGNVKYTIFSNYEGIDVSQVALHFFNVHCITGGGHVHAAGWASKTLDDIMKGYQCSFKADLERLKEHEELKDWMQ